MQVSSHYFYDRKFCKYSDQKVPISNNFRSKILQNFNCLAVYFNPNIY